MKVIFLDVDGVLNNADTTECSPDGFTGVDDMLVERLAEIVRNTGADIVLSSTWKMVLDDPNGKYLIKKLKKAGLSIFEPIPGRSTYKRGREILQYLETHPDIDRFVILDDDLFDFLHHDILLSALVLTEGRYGLTEDDAAFAVQILNAEN